MTKSTMDAIISTFGMKLVAVKFDNGEVLFLNYPDSPKTATDVTTETIGDSDFIITSRTDGMGNQYKTYHDLANFMSFVTSDTDDGYVDPLILK